MSRTMTIQRSLALLAGAVVLAGCSFEKNTVQDITGPVAGAKVKFFNFGVNAPGVNFYANDAKITAISATGCAAPNDTTTVCRTEGKESTTGTVYGGAGNAGLYATVVPGSYTLAGKIAAATDKDLVISQLTANIEAGKSYSVYLSGFYNTTAKTIDGFVLEDAFPAAIDYSVAYVRFVNAIANSAPMTLYAKSTTTTTESAVGDAVAYKSGGAFVALAPGSYDLNTRLVGSATNAISRAEVSFAAGHVYTIASRGDITVTSTTAATRPQLDNTANR
jgi:hypothetical protein